MSDANNDRSMVFIGCLRTVLYRRGKSATGRSGRWGNVVGNNPVRNNENAGSGFCLLRVDLPRVSGMILDIH